jgi:hypothetical protein
MDAVPDVGTAVFDAINNVLEAGMDVQQVRSVSDTCGQSVPWCSIASEIRYRSEGNFSSWHSLEITGLRAQLGKIHADDAQLHSDFASINAALSGARRRLTDAQREDAAGAER